MKHAKLSPSASARWLACPGSVEANWGRPHTNNKYSLEGTSAHTLLEVCMRTGSPPEDFYGMTLQKDHNVIDQDMVDGVGYALDWVAGYMANNPKATIHIEERVDYDEAIGLDKPEEGEELGFGFPDIQIDNFPAELVTLDYKHGVGISVEVDGNTQLRLYAAGKRAERGRYRKYRSVVVQPRLRGRKPIQEATYTDAALGKWLEGTVIPIVPVALAGGAPRTAGKHCRYCHADGKCPAQFDAINAAAKKEFSMAPKQMTSAQIAQALTVLDYIESMGKAIKEYAVQAVHAGVEIPGYEKAWTNTQRKWTDEEDANTLLTELGIPTPDRYSVALISPAAAEDVLKKAKKWPAKQRGVKQEFTPLDKVLTRTEPNPTIRKAQ